MSRIYASADVLLFPSVTETLGQVGLEAAASGLPVIVSDQGGPQSYVQEGETGFVLPVDDAAAWAERVRELASNLERTKQLGCQARQHITARHTLSHTLESYWDIHREAVELHRAKSHVRRPRRRLPHIDEELKSALPTRGLMVISDYHAGKKFASGKQRERKQAALEAMLQRAVAGNLEVIFAGDFGDHSADPTRLEVDFEMLRSVRQRLGLTSDVVFLRGNHDYGFTDEQLAEYTGGCQVYPSLVYFDEASGVTLTHGHILSLATTRESIRQSFCARDIEHLLREDVLDADLRPSVIAYDLANLVESALEDRGLTGLNAVWESTFQTRARLAETLLTLARQTSAGDESTWKMIAGLIGSHDDVNTMATLGLACGGWASVFGHTHEPLVCQHVISDETARTVASTTSLNQQVVGNSGNINRKRPTCLVVRFPEVNIYRFDPQTGTLRRYRSASLDEAGVAAYARQRESTLVGV